MPQIVQDKRHAMTRHKRKKRPPPQLIGFTEYCHDGFNKQAKRPEQWIALSELGTRHSRRKQLGDKQAMAPTKRPVVNQKEQHVWQSLESAQMEHFGERYAA